MSITHIPVNLKRPAVADTVLDLIGATPMVTLQRLAPEGGAEIVVKMESLNPGGSVKDRIALAMIEDAECAGALQPGDVIVEPTSGNTGVGLALVAAVKGYRLLLTMPEDMSHERRRLLARFGAEVVLTPAIEGMTGAVFAAEELAQDDGHFMPQQFQNLSNPEVHRRTTALEIWSALAERETADGARLHAFVTGVGTGGTITGVGEVLRERVPHLHVAAVEPARSPVLQGGRFSVHAIQGIGASFVPSVLNREVYDEVIGISDREAEQMTLRLTREEGILCGISSGANVAAARQVAERLGPGRRVVTTICDTGERYLSLPPANDPS